MLGSALQLGEDRQIVAGFLRIRMRHFQQHGAVALHDQRPIHNRRAYRGRRWGADLGQAGRTAVMDASGSVRSMSARRSRARSRPPPRDGGLQQVVGVGAVGQPDGDRHRHLRTDRVLELAHQPCLPGLLGSADGRFAQPGDERAGRVRRRDAHDRTAALPPHRQDAALGILGDHRIARVGEVPVDDLGVEAADAASGGSAAQPDRGEVLVDVELARAGCGRRCARSCGLPLRARCAGCRRSVRRGGCRIAPPYRRAGSRAVAGCR